jgi:hypothetical protein
MTVPQTNTYAATYAAASLSVESGSGNYHSANFSDEPKSPSSSRWS